MEYKCKGLMWLLNQKANISLFECDECNRKELVEIKKERLMIKSLKCCNFLQEEAKQK